MPGTDSDRESDPTGTPWYGGPDESVVRMMMTFIPGLRRIAREVLGVNGDGAPRA